MSVPKVEAVILADPGIRDVPAKAGEPSETGFPPKDCGNDEQKETLTVTKYRRLL